MNLNAKLAHNKAQPWKFFLLKVDQKVWKQIKEKKKNCGFHSTIEPA